MPRTDNLTATNNSTTTIPGASGKIMETGWFIYDSGNSISFHWSIFFSIYPSIYRKQNFIWFEDFYETKKEGAESDQRNTDFRLL